MGRIAITGMTASQRSASYNQTSLCFSGAIRDAVAISTTSTEATWITPSVNVTPDEMSEYDAVLVGISPISSLASNYAYPALATIDAARQAGNLTLYVDAPEPEKIKHSLYAIHRNSDLLYKDLYAKRPGYKEIAASRSIKDSVEQAIKYLLESDDKTVVYPSMPFSDESAAVADATIALPEHAVGLNFDKMYSQQTDEFSGSSADNRQFWTVDGNSSGWFKKLEKSLTYPWEKMKSRRSETDDHVSSRIQSSIGSIISPQHDGTCWWTHRYMQSLRQMVPVASEWRYTMALGNSWSTLAVSIESMSAQDRMLLAIEQLGAYVSKLEDVEHQTEKLLKAIGVTDGHIVQ